MTDEDRNIIQAMLDRTVEAIAAATRSEIKAAEERAAGNMRGMLDRAMDANAVNLSDLRGQLIRCLDTIERRTERIETNLHAVMLQTAGLSKSLS